MFDASLLELIYLAIAVYAALAALHHVLSLLDIACSYLGGAYWWWTFRQFSAEVVKRLFLVVILVKVAQWAAHMGHLW